MSAFNRQVEEFNRKECKKWMRLNEHEYDNATNLAEACAAAFGKNDIGGPLDDETHWIWDVALEVAYPD